MPFPKLALLLLLAGMLSAQPEPSSDQRIEVTLERRSGANWSPVTPSLVFAKRDELRFRVRTNFDGYLYVSDRGTSGRYVVLFPREETGVDNRVKAGVEYVVPATKAMFRIDGPPGYDTVYWMVSQTPLSSAPLPRQSIAPANVTPRCDDTIYRARSICVDASAGPRASSRDLVILSDKDQSVISSAVPLTSPFLYEFRIAHE